jgi:hypothetical protein
MKNKGMEFKLLADIVIALVAVWVIFNIFQIMAPDFVSSSVCKFYQVILAIPLPDQMKPSLAQCSFNPVQEHVDIEIDNTDSTKLAIAQKIEDCWQKADNGKSGQTFICYDFYIRIISKEITEADVTQLIKNEGKCDSLPNNYLDQQYKYFDCGGANKIYWNYEGGKLLGRYIVLIIKFDAFHHRIEVE